MSLDLFSPVQVGPYLLKNRIIMAPLTRSRAGSGNAPHDLNALYYAQRASAGLIIAEATQVSITAQGYVSTPGVHSAEQVEGWKKVTAAVHAAGGRIFLQMWHVGRASHPGFQPGGALPVAPSAILPKGKVFTATGFVDMVTPRALETEEIAGVVADFRQAALNAVEAGFDGIEIHGANGYLVDQFLRDKANQRTDRYGGSIENRARFLIEIVDAIAGAIGPDKVGLRISPQNLFNDIDDSDPQGLFNHVAQSLAPKGLAYLHVIQGDMTGQSTGTFDYLALRKLFGGLYIANHGFDKDKGNAAIASGAADLIAFGKPFISNPDLVTRYLLNAPLAEMNGETLYTQGPAGYTDYPVLAQV